MFKIQTKKRRVLKLLTNTKSLSLEEKLEWKNLLPSLNRNQTKRLLKILTEEQVKLKKLNEEHIKTIEFLNKKHLKEWEELANKNK